MEIEDIARAYRDAGFEYIALTDHSPSSTIAHGLTPERFEMQWDEIDAINKDFENEAKNGKPAFRILKGVECDIKQDGSMDLPDKVLKKFDWVVASVHSRWNMPEEEQTARIVKAVGNPYVKVLGHPLGRLINERDPYPVNMEAVINACIKDRVALEINSQPSRLDLFDYYCKMAKDKGAKFTIDSDGHHSSQIEFLKFGISVARRGWVEAKDVLNTMKLKELLKYLGK
jgi:DNA polymerase (family 10)